MATNRLQQIREQRGIVTPAVTVATPGLTKVNPTTPVLQPTRGQPTSSVNIGSGISSTLNGRAADTVKYQPAQSMTATRDRPILKTSVPKAQAADYAVLDMGGLQDELTRMQYRMNKGNISEDDAVNYGRIQRLIKQKSTNENDGIKKLQEQQAEEKRIQEEQNAKALAAFQTQQESTTANRVADYQEAGNKEREATQSALSFTGFGRSTANAEKQAQVERRTQESINAAKAISDLEIAKYQMELQGATKKNLQVYDDKILELRAKAGENALQQDTIIGSNLKDIITKSGVNLNINDEKSLEQFITIARNPDGTVNEDILKILPPSYQTIVRSGVMNGLGKKSIDRSKVKFQRIGGTNKSPVYGYIDPTTGEVKQATGAQMSLMQGGSGNGGGHSILGAGATTPVSNQATDILNDPNLSKSVGTWSVLGNVPGTAQYDFQKKVDNYINNLVLPKIKNLKGSTSDKDIAFIKAAATSLDTGMSEDAFKKTLQEMGGVLNKYDASGNPIGSSSTKTSTQKQTQGTVWSKYKSR